MAIRQRLMCTNPRSACHPPRPWHAVWLLLLCPPAGEERSRKSPVPEAVCASFSSSTSTNRVCIALVYVSLCLCLSVMRYSVWHLSGPQGLMPPHLHAGLHVSLLFIPPFLPRYKCPCAASFSQGAGAATQSAAAAAVAAVAAAAARRK